jgi:hypothetical protein
MKISKVQRGEMSTASVECGIVGYEDLKCQQLLPTNSTQCHNT